MNEIKISLNLFLRGGTMLSHTECEENPMDNYEMNRMVINTYKGKKAIPETITYRTRKCKTITRHINMSKDTYLYMINTPPIPMSISKWKSLATTVKLKKHFDLIAEDLGAESYRFDILSD